jgi:hypothetical protein
MSAVNLADIPSNVECCEIAGFPGYAIGRDGRVWTCRRRGPGNGFSCTWKVLVGGNIEGYRQVILCRIGEKVTRRVQHLVLEAFCGPRPDGLLACHNDGNRSNNDISNLRWDTQESNVADSIRHGTWTRGEIMGASKLTEENVREIRRRRELGEKPVSIGRDFGVTGENVSAVCKRLTWKHVA